MKTKNPKTLHPNKINQTIYRIRLSHNLKKCSMAELQLTQLCLTQELEKRKKGKK